MSSRESLDERDSLPKWCSNHFEVSNLRVSSSWSKSKGFFVRASFLSNGDAKGSAELSRTAMEVLISTRNLVKRCFRTFALLGWTSRIPILSTFSPSTQGVPVGLVDAIPSPFGFRGLSPVPHLVADLHAVRDIIDVLLVALLEEAVKMNGEFLQPF